VDKSVRLKNNAAHTKLIGYTTLRCAIVSACKGLLTTHMEHAVMNKTYEAESRHLAPQLQLLVASLKDVSQFMLTKSSGGASHARFGIGSGWGLF
jgi:hypothetical protein